MSHDRRARVKIRLHASSHAFDGYVETGCVATRPLAATIAKRGCSSGGAQDGMADGIFVCTDRVGKVLGLTSCSFIHSGWPIACSRASFSVPRITPTKPDFFFSPGPPFLRTDSSPPVSFDKLGHAGGKRWTLDTFLRLVPPCFALPCLSHTTSSDPPSLVNCSDVTGNHRHSIERTSAGLVFLLSVPAPDTRLTKDEIRARGSAVISNWSSASICSGLRAAGCRLRAQLLFFSSPPPRRENLSSIFTRLQRLQRRRQAPSLQP